MTLNTVIRQQPGLRLQHIQHRAKDPSSLQKKLGRAGALESDDIGAAAKDLAGCRAVFYTNSDVARFQSSGIITDNFVVDWARTKIHHPHSAEADANLFISNNYVIRLKDERLALAEYADFRDIWCELQVQTTLNHAWSEMEHDTIYKMPTLNGFGGALMQGIEKRMKKIMRDYLLRPATSSKRSSMISSGCQAESSSLMQVRCANLKAVRTTTRAMNFSTGSKSMCYRAMTTLGQHRRRYALPLWPLYYGHMPPSPDQSRRPLRLCLARASRQY